MTSKMKIDSELVDLIRQIPAWANFWYACSKKPTHMLGTGIFDCLADGKCGKQHFQPHFTSLEIGPLLARKA